MNSIWDKTVAEQATAWAELIQSGGASVQQQAAFVAWLDEADSHAEAYHEALRRPRVTEAEAAAAAQARVRAAGRNRRMRQMAMAASVVVAALVVGGLELFDGEISTRAGQTKSVTLQDGSTVQLAGATRIREEFTDAERRVQLIEGEALFEVSHNPNRPFRVDAGLQVVQAVGTAFDVSRTDLRVEVAVSEGTVAVTTKGMAAATGPAVVKLVKGEALAFQGAVTTGGVRNVPVDRIGSWRQGKVYFESAPLARVLDAMGRQYGGRFKVEDPALANKPISITFRTDTSKAEMVRLVERQMQLEAVEKPDRVTLFTKVSRSY